MDFFAAQELRRRKTKGLIALYVLAVISIIVGIYIVVAIAMGFARQQIPAEAGGDLSSGMAIESFSLFHPTLFAIVAGVNLLIIGGASISKIVELRGGGEHVASSLGGVRVPKSTTDLAQRRLLNVVEEMALAAGISVPPVYVLPHEPTINAFAAGFTPADAVIGVNQGTLDQLNRDELQGVIAHEFSHILNGDMRINIRLISVLFGIQMLATIGYFVLRSMGGYGHHTRSRNNDDKGGAGAILAIAIALLIFGSIGQFFAKWIKASLSRQREYLADASAVQFTRYPQGLGGALKVIGATKGGSAMQTPAAEQVSHMFFADSFSSMMFSMFSTHPPLVPRICQIENDFKGDFKSYFKVRKKMAQRREAARAKKADQIQRSDAMETPLGKMLPAEIAQRFSIDPMVLLAAIGSPEPADVKRSQVLIEQLPTTIKEAAHHPYSARCVAFAMLIDDDNQHADQQWRHLENIEGTMTVQTTRKLLPAVSQLHLIFRLPLMEMIQGSLADLSPPQYRTFRSTVEKLVKLDSKTSLFEFVVRHHLLMHLDRRFDYRKQPRVKFTTTQQLSHEIRLMLSAFATASELGRVLQNPPGKTPPGKTPLSENPPGENSDVAQRAYALAIDVSEIGKSKTRSPASDSAEPTEPPFEPWTVDQLEACMGALHQASMDVKKQFLYAAAVLITYDHEITITEAEFFRSVAESLDCPVPVLAAGRIQPILTPGSTETGR